MSDQVQWHDIPGYRDYEFALPDRVRSWRKRGAGVGRRAKPVEKVARLYNGTTVIFSLIGADGRKVSLTVRKLIGLTFGPDAMPPYKRSRRAGQPWLAIDLDKVRALRARGLSLDAIAARLKVSNTTIQRRLRADREAQAC